MRQPAEQASRCTRTDGGARCTRPRRSLLRRCRTAGGAAKPAMVALRAAWAAASRACSRMPGSELAGDQRDQEQHDDRHDVRDAVDPERVDRRGEEEIVGERRGDRRRQRRAQGPTAPPPRAPPADRSCRPARCPSAARSTGPTQGRQGDHGDRAGVAGNARGDRALRSRLDRSVMPAISALGERDRREAQLGPGRFHVAVQQFHMESLWAGAAHGGDGHNHRRPRSARRRWQRRTMGPTAGAAQADARRARRGVRRHRHVSPLYALQATLDPRYHLGHQRDRSLRDRQPDLLVVRLRRHDQICLHRHALRQSTARAAASRSTR